MLIFRVRVVFAVVLSCAVLAGCTSATNGQGGTNTSPVETSSSRAHATKPTSHPRKSASHTSTPPARPHKRVPHSFAGLRALLISDVPAEFVLQPDSVGDTGPSNLAKAIRDEGGQAGAAHALRHDRFLRGYQRLWVNAGGDEIILFVYQFATTAGARDYYRYSLRGTLAAAPTPTTRFRVPGLPQAGSTSFAAENNGRSFAVTEATTGPYAMQVVCNARSATGLKARLIPLAQEQFRRL